MQRLGPNGDGNSSVATLDGRSQHMFCSAESSVAHDSGIRVAGICTVMN